MTSNTANQFSPEVRELMVVVHEREHPSRWAAVESIAEKIGRTGQTLNEWVKKAGVDAGKRIRVPTDVAEKLKALEAGEPRVAPGQRDPAEGKRVFRGCLSNASSALAGVFQSSVLRGGY